LNFIEKPLILISSGLKLGGELKSRLFFFGRSIENHYKGV